MRYILGFLLPVLLLTGVGNAAVIVEGFDDLSTSGWSVVNRSSPVGTTSWFQGNPDVFPAESGDPESYAAANFENAAFGGDISTWLISPALLFRTGSIFSFYTRTTASPVAPDRLEVRMSTAGPSVGSDAASVGAFTTLLLTVNETLSIDGYPSEWNQYSVVIPGTDAAVSARIAFRYSVPDTSVRGDYIGIDTVQYDAVPEPGTWMSALLAIPMVAIARRRKRGAE